MSEQMTWLPTKDADGEKVLHLRLSPLDDWSPFWVFPLGRELEATGQSKETLMDLELADHLALPQIPKIAGFSKGWHCYLKLLQKGWKLVREQ